MNWLGRFSGQPISWFLLGTLIFLWSVGGSIGGNDPRMASLTFQKFGSCWTRRQQQLRLMSLNIQQSSLGFFTWWWQQGSKSSQTGQRTSILQDSACIMLANVSLAKTSHMTKFSIKEGRHSKGLLGVWILGGQESVATFMVHHEALWGPRPDTYLLTILCWWVKHSAWHAVGAE